MFTKFTAHVVSGSGTARKQNVPTLNLLLDDVPSDLVEGIYACRVAFQETNKPILRQSPGQANQKTMAPAVLHYGPRPVHNLPRSCEVHLLDQTVAIPPDSITVTIVERIRDVKDFKIPDALITAIQNDIAAARAILSENC